MLTTNSTTMNLAEGEKLLESLNPPQRRVVTSTEGPVLVLAGAGSGKTKALTHRVAYLVHVLGIPAPSVMAVTFTNKAAGEMKNRVMSLLGSIGHRGEETPILTTFHAFGAQLLRRHGDLIAVGKDFSIYDSEDQERLMKDILEERSPAVRRLNPRLFLSMISKAKNELKTPTHMANEASEQIEEIAAEIATQYDARLRQANAVDFDDLLVLPVRLVQNQPTLLTALQDRYQYIHIDEYQDTNHAQFVLANLLAEAHQRICVVGDDWQSIYGWRGADLRNILEFEQHYPSATVIKLEQNYRSTQPILDAAHAVIGLTHQKKEKKLWTDRSGGDHVRVVVADDERQEARLIARDIMQRMRLSRADSAPFFRDHVILYRTHAQSRAIEEALIGDRIPYRIIGGVRFYERAEIKDVLSYLRFISNPYDLLSLRRLLGVPSRGIGLTSIEKVLSVIQQRLEVDPSQSALSILAAFPDAVLDSKKSHSVRSVAATLLELRTHAESVNVTQILSQLLHSVPFQKSVQDGTEEGSARWENILELLTVAKQYASLSEFLESIALIADIDQHDPNTDAVTLMTAHNAKGLEFPCVYVIGLEEGVFPHARSLFNPHELDEEIRLCYVAMTRAKDRLILSYAEERSLYGRTQMNPVSRFIEALPDSVELTERSRTAHAWAGRTRTVVGRATPSFARTTSGRPALPSEVTYEADDDVTVSENPFAIGDNVLHPVFGSGEVTMIDNELVSVRFEGHGVKQLSIEYAPLRKA